MLYESFRRVMLIRMQSGTTVLRELAGFSSRGISWKTETIRNQMFADLWNCSNRLLGIRFSQEYREEFTWFDGNGDISCLSRPSREICLQLVSSCLSI